MARVRKFIGSNNKTYIRAGDNVLLSPFIMLKYINYRKENDNMTNIERLQLEIKGMSLSEDEISIYLEENALESLQEYNPKSDTNKRDILRTALAILEGIANNPQLMREYKTEDITVMDFHENLMNRIDALERKIRLMADDDAVYQDGASFAYMFSR